jgi:hypothetical protein
MGHPGEDAGEVLHAFIAGLDMPRSLSAVKVGPESFDRIAAQAMGRSGCRTTLGASTGRRKCVRFWNWRRER